MEGTSKIMLTWCVPSQAPVSRFDIVARSFSSPLIQFSSKQSCQTKPYHFLQHLMEFDGENSLKCYLRKRDLACGVSPVIHTNIVFSLFVVKVDLTDDGVRHLDDVIEAVFSYLRVVLPKLKEDDSVERLYRDFVSMNNAPRFFSEDVLDGVERIAKSLLRNSTRSVSKYVFVRNAILEAIDTLSRRDFNITVISQDKYDERIEYVEQKGRVKYFESKIPKKWISMWNEPKLFGDIALPAMSPYIVRDFSIFYNGTQSIPEYPIKVYESDVSELWHRRDDKFLLPTACGYFYFKTPMSAASVEKWVKLGFVRSPRSYKDVRFFVFQHDDDQITP